MNANVPTPRMTDEELQLRMMQHTASVVNMVAALFPAQTMPRRPARPHKMFVSNSYPVARIEDARASDIARWFEADESDVEFIEADGDAGVTDEQVSVKGQIVGTVVVF